MAVGIDLPKITQGTPSEQIAELQSYVHQLVQQLNWAFNVVTEAEKGNPSNVVTTGSNSGNSAPTPQSTFNSIKSLIIKSADIIEAYSDEMKERFDGDYVATSDFGVYQEETANEITKNSDSITSIYENLQTINGVIDERLKTDAWIRSGLLEYDEQGAPRYGLEVGQKTIANGEEVFNKYARFTAEGIYFYLPGVSDAVAWMSGTKLYITNAEISGSLKLGKYIVDLTSGVAFKWVGGD